MAVDVVIPAVEPEVAHETARVAMQTAGLDASVHVTHDENMDGFTKTVNRGLRTTTGDVLLMNDDIEPLTDGWLRKLVNVMEHKRKHGIKCGFVGPSGPCRTHPISEGRRAWVEGPYRPAVQVSHHPYFCTLIARDCLDEIGLLDERLIFYDSDVLHQWKAHRHGWQSWWTPMVYVDHRISGWTKRNPDLEARLTRWHEHDVAMSRQIQAESEWWLVKHG